MSHLFVILFLVTSAVTVYAQEDVPPIPPPPEVGAAIHLVSSDPKIPPSPNDPGPLEIYLVNFDPNTPPPPQQPTDPGDAGDLLILVDGRGETLTITDGRGVGLILALGDEQGTVVSPILVDWRVVGGLVDLRGEEESVFVSLGKAPISLSCGEALDLIVEAKLIDSELVHSVLDSGLTECQSLKSILVDIKPNIIKPLIETDKGTLI